MPPPITDESRQDQPWQEVVRASRTPSGSASVSLRDVQITLNDGPNVSSLRSTPLACGRRLQSNETVETHHICESSSTTARGRSSRGECADAMLHVSIRKAERGFSFHFRE